MPIERIIPNPISDPCVNKAAARQALLDELGLDRDARIVGFFANFMERKRPHIFVEIASMMCEQMTDIIFPMFGELREPTAQQINTLRAMWCIEDRVPLMGFRAPSAPYMAACDVIVVPAVGETWGRTLGEAMIVRTPVIAADDAGHKEIIRDGETGFLIEPDASAYFAAAVAYILDQKNHAHVSGIVEAAHQDVKTRFSSEAHAMAVMGVYDEILNRPGLLKRIAGRLRSIKF